MSSSDSDQHSASNSDSEAEGGLQLANASTAGPNLAHSRGQALHPSQSRSNDRSDLQTKLDAIQLQYQLHSEVPSAPSTISSRRSRTSSMAVSVLSRSTVASGVSYSQYSSTTAPSLCGSRSTIKSVSSISTVPTGSGVGQYYGREPNEDGMFEAPEEESDVRLQCCFAFLRCPRIFNDLERWDLHCRAHYRGSLPPVACCPFSECAWSKRLGQGEDIWQQRLDHMQEEHEDDDFAHQGRPDANVLGHLYRAGVIDVLQYQELRRDGHLSERPVVTAARTRDERRRRR